MIYYAQRILWKNKVGRGHTSDWNFLQGFCWPWFSLGAAGATKIFTHSFPAGNKPLPTFFPPVRKNPCSPTLLPPHIFGSLGSLDEMDVVGKWKRFAPSQWSQASLCPLCFNSTSPFFQSFSLVNNSSEKGDLIKILQDTKVCVKC